MRILGIESASMVASAALVIDGEVAAEFTLNRKKTHSQTLLPLIDGMFRLVEEDPESLDAIAVSGGPGSFTGLRIGSSTAKGIGLALKKPLIHVPTLDAFAYGTAGTDYLICPMFDARRKQVYTGLYRHADTFRVEKEQWMAQIKDLIEELNRRGEKVLLLGDGADSCREELEAGLLVPHIFAPAPANRQRAASVAALGEIYYKEGKIESAEAHTPDYLRKSQAERERDLAEKLGEMDKLAAGIVIHGAED